MTIALITKNSIYLFIKKKIFFNCTVACRIYTFLIFDAYWLTIFCSVSWSWLSPVPLHVSVGDRECIPLLGFSPLPFPRLKLPSGL